MSGVDGTGAATLEAREVKVHFAGVRAVDGVDLELGQGVIMGLIGPNGAGKTTFMNALSGFVRADGRRRAAGRRGRRPGSRRRSSSGAGSCAPSRRSRRFPDLTVFENVELGALGAGLGGAARRACARASCSRAWRSTTWRALDASALAARRRAARRHRPRGGGRSRASCCSTSPPPGSTTPESAELAPHDRATSATTSAAACSWSSTTCGHLRRLRARSRCWTTARRWPSGRRRRSARDAGVIEAYFGQTRSATSCADADVTSASHYGRVAAVQGLTLDVARASSSGLVGHNGAGKSTTLSTISGIRAPSRGDDRRSRASRSAAARPTRCCAAASRSCPRAAASSRRLTRRREPAHRHERARSDRAEAREGHRRACSSASRCSGATRDRPAGTLSGGEQQQLAIARALLARPRLLLLDEPTLGLAPLIVDQVFELLAEINREGTTILLVEQNAARTVDVADRVYIMRAGGRIEFEGTAEQLAETRRVRNRVHRVL